MPPEPMMPTTSASSLARYLTPRPAPAPTRMCWMMPSLMIARGSPLLVLKSMTRPQNVPGSMQYFSSLAPSGQRTMSDFMRMANVP